MGFRLFWIKYWWIWNGHELNTDYIRIKTDEKWIWISIGNRLGLDCILLDFDRLEMDIYYIWVKLRLNLMWSEFGMDLIWFQDGFGLVIDYI